MRAGQYYNTSVSVHTARRVWAIITRCPHISVRELAAELGHDSWSVADAALQVLREAGYIEFEYGACRARTVLIPFYVEEFQ